MKELYQLLHKYLKQDYSKSEIKSLSGYMAWLKRHYFMIGDIGSYKESYSFNFKVESKDTILDDVIWQLRNYSIAGMITNTQGNYVFDTRCTDLILEYDYQNDVGDEINWKWLDDEDNELGICRIFSRNEYREVLSVFFTDYIDFLTEFEKVILQSKMIKQSHYINFHDDHVDIDDKFQYYVEDKIIKLILTDLETILESFLVIYCGGSLYDSVEGDHWGYFVLCGYNSSRECGEGWIIKSFA